MNNENKDKKFNTTLIRAYNSKNGFLSVDIDSDAFDAIQKVELGGRLVLKQVKVKKTDKSPDAYFEYMEPEAVNKMKQFFKKYTKKTDSEDVL